MSCVLALIPLAFPALPCNQRRGLSCGCLQVRCVFASQTLYCVSQDTLQSIRSWSSLLFIIALLVFMLCCSLSKPAVIISCNYEVISVTHSLLCSCGFVPRVQLPLELLPCVFWYSGQRVKCGIFSCFSCPCASELESFMFPLGLGSSSSNCSGYWWPCWEDHHPSDLSGEPGWQLCVAAYLSAC